MSMDNQSEAVEKQYTCTQLREAGMLKDDEAPACCSYCHTRTHKGKEGQDTMHYGRTQEGRLLVLCCQVESYLLPINSELDNELKVIEGHVGA